MNEEPGGVGLNVLQSSSMFMSTEVNCMHVLECM